MAALAAVSASEGDAAAVAVLTAATGTIFLNDARSGYADGDRFYYTLKLALPVGIYGQLDAQDRASVADYLRERVREISQAHSPDELVDTVTIAPILSPIEGWRAQATKWLGGEGVTNQGRVRSDNIAARQHDGLLFRSQPEIHLYRALKERGVTFAPLPVFLHGGPNYRRIEPDFVVLYRGVVLVVEVDGDTVHRETPAEADARTTMLRREGVQVERVKASDCDTPSTARRCADGLVEALERYRELRG